jgi:hypothetical protein
VQRPRVGLELGVPWLIVAVDDLACRDVLGAVLEQLAGERDEL